MTEEGAIAARGLSKRFGGVFALRDLDLDVPPGTCLAVLGPNGAGKSTLLRLIAGLARPSAGSLHIGEHRATARAARARIGFVGHATLLYAALTARENLIFAARLHGIDNPGDRADAALAREGLLPVAHWAAGSFSRGMAQRLAIARGLVHDPAVVLLDEPFTGLDRGAADRLTERLTALRDEGRTLVLVTHDVAGAAAIADAALVLAAGRAHFATARAPDDPDAVERAYLEAAGDGR